MNPLLLLAVIFQVGAAQPPPVTTVTTDVDENTTPAEASPLAPSRALNPAVIEEGRSLDDILSAVRPVETPTEPAAPEEAPRPGLVLATPADSPTAVAPTFINDRNSRPDGPPSESDTLYETRILGAFRAAQNNQGPLDGRWLVARPGGEVLYSLQFTDPGAGDERIEGAWRNMKVAGLGGSGFIDAVRRNDSELVVSFEEPNARRTEEVRVRPTNDGAWKGEVLTAAGRVQVVMSRDQSVEVAAQDAPIYIPPPPPPPRPAQTCKRVKSKGKWKTVCSRAGVSKSKASKGSSKKGKASSGSKKKGSSSKSSSSKKPTAKKKK